MAKSLASYIALPDGAVRPGMPKLRPKIGASKKLALTLPFTIQVTVGRRDSAAEKPIIFD
ncbi:hypothetical protein BCR34DRAFT_578227 [Clohesyomyces aquaticus]|uniref:Uncharacterized protein n=1 Tax=Clohesyomyces aquaticus TaxID=1231657 RepID=A0A1Y1YGM7_9PLEO|nr:hypothetical protein BCR34DRAFT_578227 [Clohesyomyces aquaticus]